MRWLQLLAANSQMTFRWKGHYKGWIHESQKNVRIDSICLPNKVYPKSQEQCQKEYGDT